MSAYAGMVVLTRTSDPVRGNVYLVVAHPDTVAWQGRTLSREELMDFVDTQTETFGHTVHIVPNDGHKR